MLPSELLRVKIYRGKIKPIYAPINDENISVAQLLIDVFKRNVGRGKKNLLEEVQGYEGIGYNYKFIRGLTTLLERRCILRPKFNLDPVEVRKLIFKEVGGFIYTEEERLKILKKVAEKLNLNVNDVEKGFLSDLEGDFTISKFEEIDPEILLKQYNLSLTQTLLFNSIKLRFYVRSNWREIFRRIKWLKLMYSIKRHGKLLHVEVDGPASTVKLTRRYGTAIAKLLSEIIRSSGWRIEAEILWRNNKKYFFSLNSFEAGRFIESIEKKVKFASNIEEEFYNRFKSLGTSWSIIYEPEPLEVDGHVMIPDFMFKRGNLKVYMEIVGFWTEEYLRRKIEKLKGIKDVKMIVAVNSDLSCRELKKIRGEVLFYKGKIPLKPILKFLKKELSLKVREKVEELRGLKTGEEIISINELSRRLEALTEAIEEVIRESNEYWLIGGKAVRRDKALRILREIERRRVESLDEAAEIIEKEGIDDPVTFLIKAGYKIKWRGLDRSKAAIKRQQLNAERQPNT